MLKKKTFDEFLCEVFSSPSEPNPDLDKVVFTQYNRGSGMITAKFKLFDKGQPFTMNLSKISLGEGLNYYFNLDAFSQPGQRSGRPQGANSDIPDDVYDRAREEMDYDEGDISDNAYDQASNETSLDDIDIHSQFDNYIYSYRGYPLGAVMPFEIPRELNQRWGADDVEDLMQTHHDWDMEQFAENILTAVIEETPKEFLWAALRSGLIIPDDWSVLFGSSYEAHLLFVESLVKDLESENTIPYFSIQQEFISTLAEKMARGQAYNNLATTPDERTLIQNMDRDRFVKDLVLSGAMGFEDMDVLVRALDEDRLVSLLKQYVEAYLDTEFLDGYVYESEGPFQEAVNYRTDEIREEMMRDFNQEVQSRAEAIWADEQGRGEEDDDRPPATPREELLKKIAPLKQKMRNLTLYSVVLSGGLDTGTPQQAQRVFGLVASILYKVSKELKPNGFVFYGSTKSRHKLYRRMLLNKMFQRDFGKLGYKAFVDYDEPLLGVSQQHVIKDSDVDKVLADVKKFKSGR